METRDNLESVTLDEEPQALFEVEPEENLDTLTELERLARGTLVPPVPAARQELPDAASLAFLNADPVLPNILGDLAQPQKSSPAVKILAGTVVALVCVVIAGGAMLMRGHGAANEGSTLAAAPAMAAMDDMDTANEPAPAMTPAADPTTMAADDEAVADEEVADEEVAADETETADETEAVAAADETDTVAGDENEAAAPQMRAMPRSTDERPAAREEHAMTKTTVARQEEERAAKPAAPSAPEAPAVAKTEEPEAAAPAAAAPVTAAATAPATPAAVPAAKTEGLPDVAESGSEGKSIDDLLDRGAGDLQTAKAEAAPTKTELTKADVKDAMTSIHPKLMGCALRNEIVGVAKVRFTVYPDGSVKRAKAVGHDGTPFSECVSERVRSVRFDAFSGAPKTITYPVMLK